MNAKGFVTGAILILAASVAFAGKPVQPPPATGDITAVTAGAGLSGGGTSGDVTLSLKSCAAGQVLVWSGAAWECMTGGDVTAVTAGSGLTGGGNSGPVNIAVKTCPSGQILRSTGGDWACETPPEPPSVAGQLFVLPGPGGGDNAYYIHSKFARLRNSASDGVYQYYTGKIAVSWVVTGAGPAAGAAASMHDCIEAGWIFQHAGGYPSISAGCVSEIVGVLEPMQKVDWLAWPPAADALGSTWGMD